LKEENRVDQSKPHYEDKLASPSPLHKQNLLKKFKR